MFATSTFNATVRNQFRLASYSYDVSVRNKLGTLLNGGSTLRDGDPELDALSASDAVSVSSDGFAYQVLVKSGCLSATEAESNCTSYLGGVINRGLIPAVTRYTAIVNEAINTQLPQPTSVNDTAFDVMPVSLQL